MKLRSISSKIFVAFIVLITVILGASLLLSGWSFQRSISNYVSNLEQSRLESMAIELQHIYEANGRVWPSNLDLEFDEVLRKWHPRRRGPRAGANSPEQGSNNFELPPPERPPSYSNNGDRQSAQLFNRPARARQLTAEGEPPRPDDRHPTQLLDQNTRILAGVRDLPESQTKLKHKLFDLNGKFIASLVTIIPKSSNSSLESAFIRQQWNTTLAIGLVAIIVALGLVWLAVKTLIAPIKSMKGNIAELAKGNYQPQPLPASDDELGDLINDVNFLSSVLNSNKQARQNMFADISHELRTPLTVLVAEIEAIRDGIRKFDTKQLNSIELEVLRLKKLVDDLYQLSLSDIGGLHYDFKPCEVAPLIEQSIKQSLPLIGKDDFNIEQHLSPNVSCNLDSSRFGQLLTNILNNSIAYTDKPGKLIVTSRRESDHCLITFEDSSPTVSEHALDDIFAPLHRREKSRNRRSGGAGLGLAICRNIIAAHQGKIWAEQSELGGIKIAISIPLL